MTQKRSSMPDSLHLTRRAALSAFGATAFLGHAAPALAFGNTADVARTSASDPRLIILNLRGGLDGLSAVVPYGDPNLIGLRASLLPKTLLKIDGFYATDPGLPNFHAMVTAGEGLVVHAVGPCAFTRSHFQGQDYLQSGTPALLNNGWLNRVLSLLPQNGSLQLGLAVSPTTPLVIRGATQVAGWSTDTHAQINTNLSTLVQTETSGDGIIGEPTQVALQDRAIFNAIFAQQTPPASSSRFIYLAGVAGTCLASSYGPRIAVLETDSVDTHYDQTAHLASAFSDIDGALAVLKTTLGSAWANTVVLTMTEFGRTAYANGSFGTDHGTGFAVLLAGGAVAGGRVVANWPGLAMPQLFQNRDLYPTTDFRAVALGILEDHLKIAASQQEFIFPGSTGLVTPLAGLVYG